MLPVVATHLAEIASICRLHRIRRLEVFGSAARGDDFDDKRSDIDFLLEFEPDAHADIGTYFEAKVALEALLGRDVDLLEQGAVKNPYVRRQIDRERKVVYAS